MVWKTSTRICFATAYIGEKHKIAKYKNKRIGTAGISKSGSGKQLLYAKHLRNYPTSQGDKQIQQTNMSENIPLPNKYALTGFTKNLFKDADHLQAT